MRTSTGTIRWLRTSLALGVLAVLTSACASHLTDEELLEASTQQIRSPRDATPGSPAVTDTVTDTADGGQGGGQGGAIAPAPASQATARGSLTPAVSGASSPAGVRAGDRQTSAPPTATRHNPANPATVATGPGAVRGAPGGAGRPTNGSAIKLGNIGPVSGPIGAALQPLFDATRSWVADVNARGGLAGHPVELIFADDHGDPNQALALTRRLVEEDKVLAFYALPAVTTAEVVMEYLEKKQVPVIGSCGCIPAVADSPMLFDVGDGGRVGTAWEHIGPMLEAGLKPKLGVLYCREASSCSLLKNHVVELARRLGLQVAYEAQVSLAQPDFTAEVFQARQAGVEAIIPVTENATAIRILRSAHRQNWSPLMNVPHAVDDRFVTTGGADVEGVFTATPVADWTSSPLMEDYRKALSRYTTNPVLGGVGAVAWVAGKLLERLATTFPVQPTTQSFLDALYSLKQETLGGRIAPTTYLPGQSHDSSSHCNVPLRVERGKLTAFKGHNTFSCVPGWKPL